MTVKKEVSRRSQVVKEDAMWLQKELINRNYAELGGRTQRATEGRGDLRAGQPERAPDVLRFARSLPETNALQNAMRKKSGRMVLDAERDGHSEDVCTYVKADLGMMLAGEKGPTGEALPRPDVLLLSYTGCFTFMKWFELVRQKYDCETTMLHVPYQGDGRINPACATTW
jgi:benzoyl-CoA reductase subunit B